MAALIPQYVHVSSVFSNDPFGNLAGARLFWLLSQSLLQSRHLAFTAFLGVAALVFPFLSKLTVLGVSAAVVITSFMQEVRRETKRVGVYIGILGIGVVFVGLFWWIQPARFFQLMDVVSWRLLTVNENALDWEVFKDRGLQVVWSFWGFVGWLSVGLTGHHMLALTRGALIGALRSVWELIPKRSGIHSYLGAPWSIWAIAGFSALAVAKNALNTVYSQGRFLFPAMGALVFLVIGGWHALLPKKWKPFLIYFVVAILLYSNLVLWFKDIIPFYYQPFLD
jgi:hypothetical protein